MTVSILHIGLPLDHPSIPADDAPRIAKRLSDLHDLMTAAGYHYEIIHASPETGLDSFKHRLSTQPCDGVLIGGGVIGNPALSYFLEQIINTTHEAASKAKIMFFNHSVDVRTTVERWFKPGIRRRHTPQPQAGSPLHPLSGPQETANGLVFKAKDGQDVSTYKLELLANGKAELRLIGQPSNIKLFKLTIQSK